MLSISRSILISAPRESVRVYLQDLSNASQYESKLGSLEVASGADGSFSAQAGGRFLGMPWSGSFEVRLTSDGGYVAEMSNGSRVTRSIYHLRSVTGGTVLTHEEYYEFSLLVRPFERLFASSIGHSMDLELRVIKEEAERVNRRLQLQQIEKSA